MTLPRFAATSYDFTEYVPARNWIGGAWREAAGKPASQPVPNPRWGRPMSTVQLSGAADVDAAVAAARAAFPAWRDLPIRDRAQILYKTRELLLRDLAELSWLVSHENGKIYSEAEAEVLKAIECLEYGCSLPNLATGSELEVSRGVTCGLTYEPLGVVAGVVPFNFPLMVPMWMLPQALAGGNAFILKPSERVPLSAMRLAELFAEAGLPAGIFSLVQGGRETVEALCDHPGIEALGFVGSTRVARAVYARACAAGKRALCLGGAKNHLILVPDADPDVAVENIVASFTGCAGQRCMAASVLLAVGEPAEIDPLLGRIAQRAAAIRLGSEMGPVATAAAAERITNAIANAAANGAQVIVDGRGRQPERPKGRARGSGRGLVGRTDDSRRGRPVVGGRLRGDLRSGALHRPGSHARSRAARRRRQPVRQRRHRLHHLGRRRPPRHGHRGGGHVRRECRRAGAARAVRLRRLERFLFRPRQHHRLGRFPLLDAAAQDHHEVGVAARQPTG